MEGAIFKVALDTLIMLFQRSRIRFWQKWVDRLLIGVGKLLLWKGRVQHVILKLFVQIRLQGDTSQQLHNIIFSNSGLRV